MREVDWPAPPVPRWADAATTGGLQERARTTRRELLVGAAEVIDRSGYSAASLRDITGISGATKGALYFHFQSKHGLAEALVAEAIASWDDVVHRIDGLDLDPLCTLLLCYDAYTARLMHDTSARAALRIAREGLGGEHFRCWAGRWDGSVGNLLVRAHDGGALRGHIDPAWLGRHVQATTTGHFQMAEARPGGPSMWERMNDTWSGLLPAVATVEWLAAWQSSGWSSRPEPDPGSYRRPVA